MGLFLANAGGLARPLSSLSLPLSSLSGMMLDCAETARVERDYVSALEYVLTVSSVDDHPKVTAALAAMVLDVIEALKLAPGAAAARERLTAELSRHERDFDYGALRESLNPDKVLHVLDLTRLFAGGPYHGAQSDEVATELIAEIYSLLIKEEEYWHSIRKKPMLSRSAKLAAVLVLLITVVLITSRSELLEYLQPKSPVKSAADAPQPPLSEEVKAWMAVKSTASEAALRGFIDRFPNGVYANFARARIRELKIQELKQSQKAALVSHSEPTSRHPHLLTCDGVLVPVAQSGAKQCIRPGSGESFKDCPECPGMVVVPAGSFTMGSPPDEPERHDNEGPRHAAIHIAKPFAVGQLAVTFAEWDACAESGGCGRTKPQDSGWDRGELPVVNVSWNDAEAYVKWISQKTGKPYRLLTEAEREYVTQVRTATPFRQANSIPDKANYDGNHAYNGGEKCEDREKTVPAKSFQPNPWGLYQVHRNVWEWTEDCWNDTYNGAPSDGSAWTAGNCTQRVLRGWSCYVDPRTLRAAYRLRDYSEDRSSVIGFRVARSLTP